MMPGLDFYNGVQLAIDSLNAEKQNVEVSIIDTKQDESNFKEKLASREMQDVELIIASFNNRNELKLLADFALEKKIPLLSATYPNDGGVTSNPYFVLLNPTLNAHLESIYRFIKRTYPNENIQYFRRKGNVEDLIQNTIADLNKRSTGSPLKLRVNELPDSILTNQVTEKLDSNRLNVVVCGSVNESFGLALGKALSSSKKYRVIAIGMPTWDGIRDISKDLEVVYTTPYNFNRTEKTGIQITESYKNKFAGRPSDMVYKGFEVMFHFTHLALKYGDQLIAHLSEKDFKTFHDFDIQPVKLQKENTTPDYLENKKLIIIRKADGKIKSSN